MAQITLKDIAKALNLSPSTVSRAMRDHPAISKKTRKIVKDYAEAHKYKPNRLALQLRTNKRRININQTDWHYSCVLIRTTQLV